jgi:hypothetical protein
MATKTEKCLWAARPLMESAPVPQKRRLEMNYRQQENELKNNHKKMEKIIKNKKSQVQHKHLFLLNCGRYGDKRMCRLLNADSSQDENLLIGC